MGSSFCIARLQRGWKSHAKEKLTGNSATMLLKRNEFKKKQKKLKISLDNKIESGIHSHSQKSAPRIIRGVLLFRPRIFSCLRHRRRLFLFLATNGTVRNSREINQNHGIKELSCPPIST